MIRYRFSFRSFVVLGLSCAAILQVGVASGQVIPSGALPDGGRLVAGQAQILLNPGKMEIHQETQKLVLDWRSFNIGSEGRVDFFQPGAGSVALNRVISGDPSRIFGGLSANGQVFLLNPAGIIFGSGSRVDVGGLVASTLSITNSDFLADRYRFTREDGAQGIINSGSLIASEGGYLTLLAPRVTNAGLLEAQGGTVALVAGDAVTLELASLGAPRLLSLQVDPATVSTLVENRQLIRADGGSVLLTARAIDGLVGGVINSGGLIEAQAIYENEDGILLDGGVLLFQFPQALVPQRKAFLLVDGTQPPPPGGTQPPPPGGTQPPPPGGTQPPPPGGVKPPPGGVKPPNYVNGGDISRTILVGVNQTVAQIGAKIPLPQPGLQPGFPPGSAPGFSPLPGGHAPIPGTLTMMPVIPVLPQSQPILTMSLPGMPALPGVHVVPMIGAQPSLPNLAAGPLPSGNLVLAGVPYPNQQAMPGLPQVSSQTPLAPLPGMPSSGGLLPQVNQAQPFPIASVNPAPINPTPISQVSVSSVQPPPPGGVQPLPQGAVQPLPPGGVQPPPQGGIQPPPQGGAQPPPPPKAVGQAQPGGEGAPPPKASPSPAPKEGGNNGKVKSAEVGADGKGKAGEAQTEGRGSAVEGKAEGKAQDKSGGGDKDGDSGKPKKSDNAKPVKAVAQAGRLAQLAVADAVRHQARTELYKEALTILRQNPQAADLPTCGAGSAALCIPPPVELAKVGGVGDSAPGSVSRMTAETAGLGLLPATPVQRKIAYLIGNNDYTGSIPPLETPIADVEVIGSLLNERLGYEVKLIKNASKADIVSTLKMVAEGGARDESVLVMYAGHGYQMDDTRQGYWIPVDASNKSPEKWLSNSDIGKFLGAIPAKQIILISDSCFSGTLTKEQKVTHQDGGREHILSRRSVLAMSSGGEEPVSDEGKDGHSIFAYTLIKHLKKVDDFSTGSQLFENIKGEVAREFPQEPQLGALTSAGHTVGGDYLFEINEYLHRGLR